MTQKFFELDDDELTFIPFDIETTGFKAADGDFITNIVLFHQDNYHIWINTDGNEEDASEMKERVLEGSELENVVLYVCETEREMLLNLKDYLDTQTDNNTILTAFNGETWRGDTDFDVPFMRTRCFRNGVPWVLDGFWYNDTFEVISKSSRFDTTVKASPSLEDMKRSDLEDFVDDMGYKIHYDKMKKAEIVSAVDAHNGISPDALERWAENNVSESKLSRINPDNTSSFNASHLKDFIDTNSIDIPYDKLSKDDLIREIRECDFSEQMLIDWHKQTGRSIGTDEKSDLDSVHEVLIEDMMDDEEWRRNLPFDIEVFEPFDPFENSGEAVTAYVNGDYAGVILHCFADVARTVNITRMMVEYAPKKDYKPKVL